MTANEIVSSEPNLLPLLPLRDVVVFPHMVIPLFVGRPKSIKAMEIAMEAGKSIILVAQKSASKDEPGAEDLYKIGCVANILQMLKLPDGTVKAGTKWVTTPLEVAAEISKGLAASVVVAKVNDAVWDVFRPLEEDCTLKLCTFEDPEGRDVRGERA